MDEAEGAEALSDGDLARRISGAGAAADDLVQEVLMLTLERLRTGKVREPDQVASFVFGTCRLSIRNQRRSRKRHDALLDRFADVFPRRAEPDPLLLDQGRLRQCLEGLDPRDRTVLVLTFYAEQPSSEIGTRLSISSENVRTVRRRAFVKLRDCVLGAAT